MPQRAGTCSRSVVRLSARHLEAVAAVEREPQPAVAADDVDLVRIGCLIGEHSRDHGAAARPPGEHGGFVFRLTGAAQRADVVDLLAEQVPPEVDVMGADLVQDTASMLAEAAPLGSGRPRS